MPGSYADAQPRVWTPSFALPLLAACTGLSKANLCIVYGCFARSQRKSSTLRAICTKSPKVPPRGARASRATPDYDRYVGLLIDEAVEYNKQHSKTYNLEEAKVEVRRRVAEKLADHEL